MIIFLAISLNLCVGCLKESSHWDSSFEYSQYMFWLRNKKKIFWYTLLSGGLVFNSFLTCGNLLSADNLRKQFGSRSGSTGQSWPGSKQLDTLMAFLIFCWKKHNFEEEKVSRQKLSSVITQHAKSWTLWLLDWYSLVCVLSSQRIKFLNCFVCFCLFWFFMSQSTIFKLLSYCWFNQY